MLSKRLRRVLLGVLICTIVALVGIFVVTQRTIRVYVVSDALPRYTQLSDNDLEPRTIPRTAAREIDAVTQPQAAIGRYLTAPVQRETVLHDDLLIDEPPCDRVFHATGRCIPRGREAVLVPVPATVGGVVQNEDLVNVWALHANATREEIQILLQKVPPLGVVGNGKKLALALTPDELALLAPFLTDDDRQQTQNTPLLFSLTTESGQRYDRLATFPLTPRSQGDKYLLVDDESFLPPNPNTYLNTEQAPQSPSQTAASAGK